MKVDQKYNHKWCVTPSEAREIQDRLREELILHDDFNMIEYAAGVDAGYRKKDRIIQAAVCTLTLSDLHMVEYSLAKQPADFPYIPGLLSFREIPAVLAAMEKLGRQPDILICDGQGTAHPRRMGIAAHLGLITGIPSLGVAKSRLAGTHDRVPDIRGAWVPLIDKDEIIGAVLRTRKGVKPVYVSPGHRIGLETAVNLVMKCTTRYRLPETTRTAHRLAKLAAT
ncbi:MAG TPA: deoxyribonuclease V [Thermodesulfobacteriaceae bacterium]|nr:deoxyribonuclease V [Thermodesulfobacteriaceae bacterium]